jgi:hypothetical protein
VDHESCGHAGRCRLDACRRVTGQSARQLPRALVVQCGLRAAGGTPGWPSKPFDRGGSCHKPGVKALSAAARRGAATCLAPSSAGQALGVRGCLRAATARSCQKPRRRQLVSAAGRGGQIRGARGRLCGGARGPYRARPRCPHLAPCPSPERAEDSDTVTCSEHASHLWLPEHAHCSVRAGRPRRRVPHDTARRVSDEYRRAARRGICGKICLDYKISLPAGRVPCSSRESPQQARVS